MKIHLYDPKSKESYVNDFRPQETYCKLYASEHSVRYKFTTESDSIRCKSCLKIKDSRVKNEQSNQENIQR